MLTLPMFDPPTQCMSGFLTRYVVPRTMPFQLVGPLSTKRLFSTLPKGDVLIMVGHGAPTLITGQNEVVLLEVKKYNANYIAGKVIKLISCESGRILAPDLVENGALSVQGYTEDLVWVLDYDYIMRPWADEMAATAMLPIVCSTQLLLDGKTSQESFDAEVEGFSLNAEKEEDELIKACLEFDRDNAVLLGDGEARIKARPKISFPIPPPPLIPLRT